MNKRCLIIFARFFLWSIESYTQRLRLSQSLSPLHARACTRTHTHLQLCCSVTDEAGHVIHSPDMGQWPGVTAATFLSWTQHQAEASVSDLQQLHLHPVPCLVQEVRRGWLSKTQVIQEWEEGAWGREGQWIYTYSYCYMQSIFRGRRGFQRIVFKIYQLIVTNKAFVNNVVNRLINSQR